MTHPLIEDYEKELDRRRMFNQEFKAAAFEWLRESIGLVPGDLFQISGGEDWEDATLWVVTNYIEGDYIVCPQANKGGRIHLRQGMGGRIRVGFGIHSWRETKPLGYERICGQGDRDTSHDYWIETCKARAGIGAWS